VTDLLIAAAGLHEGEAADSSLDPDDVLWHRDFSTFLRGRIAEMPTLRFIPEDVGSASFAGNMRTLIVEACQLAVTEAEWDHLKALADLLGRLDAGRDGMISAVIYIDHEHAQRAPVIVMKRKLRADVASRLLSLKAEMEPPPMREIAVPKLDETPSSNVVSCPTSLRPSDDGRASAPA
jgi:hypothetical protein